MRPTLLLILATAPLAAQSHVVATVPVADATATGVLAVSNGNSVLGDSSGVTTGAHPARVTLLRGGELELCQGSAAHLTASAGPTEKQSVVVGLDRGALEFRDTFTPADAIVTPDLRITSADSKARPLNLALRVTRTGDTCIDNRGTKAPAINVNDNFATGTYQIKPGQRVLFEHGSLREVVDREQGPCGCPIAQPGAKYPFPEAVSEGLADPTPPPAEAPGVIHTQVSTNLDANPGTEPPPAIPAQPTQPAAATARPASKPGFFAFIGDFFKRIFVR